MPTRTAARKATVARKARKAEAASSSKELARRSSVAARYDAAQTTRENRRHWAGADGLGPDAAASANVRRTLRYRARHEVNNNCYGKGIVLTLANDVVGTGPRLQLELDDRPAARIIEQSFSSWMRCVRAAAKLRTMVMARVTDGEAFGVMQTNGLLRHPVLLDFRLIEADMVCTPQGQPDADNVVDGITFDEAWNPISYSILSQHPGEATRVPVSIPYDASKVMHTFREDRPGQSRGVPEITQALPLFALLRQFSLAVLRAADTAADWAAVMQTTLPTLEAAEVETDVDSLELERGTVTALPEGWELAQIDAKQPTTTYAMFKAEILNEIARVLSMPFNVAACNSSSYNYASGRLDHQVYGKALRVMRSEIEDSVLDRLFIAWVEEASLLPGIVPANLRDLMEIPHKWAWDTQQHVDPAKEASAQETRLRSLTTTLADEYAAVGKNWEPALEQRAKEIQKCAELGIPMGSAGPAAPSNEPAEGAAHAA